MIYSIKDLPSHNDQLPGFNGRLNVRGVDLHGKAVDRVRHNEQRHALFLIVALDKGDGEETSGFNHRNGQSRAANVI